MEITLSQAIAWADGDKFCILPKFGIVNVDAIDAAVEQCLDATCQQRLGEWELATIAWAFNITESEAKVLVRLIRGREWARGYRVKAPKVYVIEEVKRHEP